MWSTQCQGLRRRQHRTEHKEHTPNPRTEIKIPDPAGNRTRTAWLEGSESTDHVTATEIFNIVNIKIQLSMFRNCILDPGHGFIEFKIAIKAINNSNGLEFRNMHSYLIILHSSSQKGYCGTST